LPGDAFVRKPFDPEEIVSAVARLLPAREAGGLADALGIPPGEGCVKRQAGPEPYP